MERMRIATFEVGLLHKALVFNLKFIAFIAILPFLLLMGFPHLQTIVLIGAITLWDAFHGFPEGPTASVFLLLNCIIVTIIASTKFEHMGAHEQGELVGGGQLCNSRSRDNVELKKLRKLYKKQILRSSINDDSYNREASNQSIKPASVAEDEQDVQEGIDKEEMTASSRAGEGLAVDEQVPTKKIKVFNHVEKPPPHSAKRGQIRGPTLDEVWSAIHDGGGDERRHSGDDEQKLESPKLGAALEREPSMSLEELNQRAEEFIARFNQQMRLQRQESMQRRYMLMLDTGVGVLVD